MDMSAWAANVRMKYGSFQFASTFKHNDEMAALREGESVMPPYSAAFDPTEHIKRHAACDECRECSISTCLMFLIRAGKRKLRCSGENTGCCRCLKQNLVCHYSEQKQMGRPRKKQKTVQNHGDTVEIPDDTSDTNRQRMVQIIDPADQLAFERLCPGPFIQYLKKKTPPPRAPFLTTGPIHERRSNSLTGGSDSTNSSTSPPTPPTNEIPNILYPTDPALWPDYSDMFELPQIVQDNHEDQSLSQEQYFFPDSEANSTTLSDQTGTVSSFPSCPCLPNLYLTLSTLTTLSSFPIAAHAIVTLQTAARTAHSVLYCGICPRKFQSGLQNVTLLGTLLIVLADAWHRVRKTPPEDIRKGFSLNISGSLDTTEPVARQLRGRERLEWLTFRHELIRNNVFADCESPIPPTPHSSAVTGSSHNENSQLSSPTPGTALLPLIEAMVRRQSQWHNPVTATGEFPTLMQLTDDDGHEGSHLGMSLKEIKKMEQHGRKDEYQHVCLMLVSRARSAVQGLDGLPPVYGD